MAAVVQRGPEMVQSGTEMRSSDCDATVSQGALQCMERHRERHTHGGNAGQGV